MKSSEERLIHGVEPGARAEALAEFGRARVRAIRMRPYFATALYALTPIITKEPGLKTAAVDDHWRVYINPDYFLTTLRQLAADEARRGGEIESQAALDELADDLYRKVTAALLLHELEHALCDDSGRRLRNGIGSSKGELSTWNRACDARINDGLLEDGLTWEATNWVFPASFGAPNNLSPEFYYDLLARRRETQQQDQETPQDEGDPSAGSGVSGQSERASAEGPTQSGSRPAPGAQSASREPSSERHARDGSGGDQSSETPARPASGRGNEGTRGVEDSSHVPDDEAPSEALASQPESRDEPAQPAAAAGNGSAQQPDSSAGAASPQPGNGPSAPSWTSCSGGSGVTGESEEWEETSAGETSGPDGFGPGVDSIEKDAIRRRTASDVKSHENRHGRGSVPGRYTRWADAVLPAVDGQQLLRSMVRTGLRKRQGAQLSYARPHRRSTAHLPRPGQFHRETVVALVVDSSASVDDDELALELGLVHKVVRSAANELGVRVAGIACNAEVTSVVEDMRNEAQLNLEGGGTDMRLGIDAALKMREPPEVIVVATDGETPWPEAPIPGVDLIAALCRPTKVGLPDWLATVDLTASDGRPGLGLE